MNYFYNRRSLPAIDPTRLLSLEKAAERLVNKLQAITVQELPLSAYGQENLTEARARLKETMKKYVHLAAWAMSQEMSASHEAFVDYGGGHGMLACLAKESGFPRVIYNDIFDQCCKDARVLAEHLNCPADEYICGDIHTVHGSLKVSRPASCTLASINVIEHIYDMDDFIKVASSISDGPMTMVLSTSANPLNPIVRRRHFRQHREWELTDGPHKSSYPMDSVKAFRSIRREIIQKCAPELSDADVEAMTAATRGLRKDDIEKCVRQFKETRRILVEPNHPTNTCDPLTGSWQERLLDVSTVCRELEAQGFSTTVLAGYYNDTAAHAVKRVAARILNHAISFSGGWNGARLAPCFMFRAVRAGLVNTKSS
jgi:hypothetical protein